MHRNWKFFAASIVLCLCSSFHGCRTADVGSSLLPETTSLERDQLIIHSDFHVPLRHRLIDELVLRREDISEALSIPTSDEPINIFLFEDSQKFKLFMQKSHPEFSDRRAFFVKTDTQLKIFAHWGSRVGEDLRHEVTHGYLHSVISNVPLWLDEGIAEYFEVSRGTDGLNDKHVYLLSRLYRQSEWLPDLARLERITSPGDLTQNDYAESWLWVHYLLNHDDATRKLVQDHLARLRLSGNDTPLSAQLSTLLPDMQIQVVNHLRDLVKDDTK